MLDEDTGQPIAARMHLKDQRGKPVNPPGLVNWHDHFVLPGKAVLRIRPGHVHVRDGTRARNTASAPATSRSSRAMRTTSKSRCSGSSDMKKEGWWSGDLHIHRPPKDIELLMLAEDLHVAPLITWWNDSNAWARDQPPDKLLVQFNDNRFYHLHGRRGRTGRRACCSSTCRSRCRSPAASGSIRRACRFLNRPASRPACTWTSKSRSGGTCPCGSPAAWSIRSGCATTTCSATGCWPTKPGAKPATSWRYPDPHGNGRWTQEIYYQLLNCGLRLAAVGRQCLGRAAQSRSATTACTCTAAPTLDYDKWWENLRAGQVVVTNGPLIRDPRVNGQLPGHVFQAPAGQTLKLQATLNLSLREPVDYLEIVKNGEVASSRCGWTSGPRRAANCRRSSSARAAGC